MPDDRDELRKEMDAALAGGVGPRAARFALSCLGGLIPFGGGVLGGASDAWSEAEDEQFKKIVAAWLKLQEDELREIGRTLLEVMERLDLFDEEVQERVESPGYLTLVKKAFRDWSAAESEDKRQLIRNLLANAAATKVSDDKVVRLFIEWIERYSELHFSVVREIYSKQAGITRHEIWMNIYGEIPREDSAEADLFKLIIRDLSVGSVIRQYRQVDYYGNFLKKKPSQRKGGNRMKSAFDDSDEYVLTALGQQFVHYTMEGIIRKIGVGQESGESDL